MLTDTPTDKYHKKKHFRWWNVFDDTCRMRRRSFRSWFDLNRSTFAEDRLGYARKTIFIIFVPSDLDLKFTSLLLFSAMFPLN